MPQNDHMLTPREAARLIGISYPTIKSWILSGKLATLKTPGGHHRVPERALRAYIKADASKPPVSLRERFRQVSGRNQILGKIVSLRVEGLLAEVIVATADAHITSIITANAVRELALEKGQTVAALIKSTDVMIERIDKRR